MLFEIRKKKPKKRKKTNLKKPQNSLMAIAGFVTTCLQKNKQINIHLLKEKKQSPDPTVNAHLVSFDFFSLAEWPGLNSAAPALKGNLLLTAPSASFLLATAARALTPAMAMVGTGSAHTPPAPALTQTSKIPRKRV